MVPFSAGNMSRSPGKIQQVSSRNRDRVRVESGNWVLLLEDEAQSFPNYWWPNGAMAINLMSCLLGRSSGHPGDGSIQSLLTESLWKGACLELIHDRNLVCQQPSPMLSLITNLNRITPLIWSLPDSSKPHTDQQDHLQYHYPHEEDGRHTEKEFIDPQSKNIILSQ